MNPGAKQKLFCAAGNIVTAQRKTVPEWKFIGASTLLWINLLLFVIWYDILVFFNYSIQFLIWQFIFSIRTSLLNIYLRSHLESWSIVRCRLVDVLRTALRYGQLCYHSNQRELCSLVARAHYVMLHGVISATLLYLLCWALLLS